MKTLKFFATIFATCLLTGCSMPDIGSEIGKVLTEISNLGKTLERIVDGFNNELDKSTEEFSHRIDDAIYDITTESKDWREALEALQKDIPEQIQSTIKVELDNLIKSSIAATGAEFRCNTDFIKGNIKFSLENLKKRILKEKATPVPPYFCQVVPESLDYDLVIENRTKTLKIFSFNFHDINDFKVFLRDKNNKKQEVSEFLSKSTAYCLVLNMSENGVNINQDSQSITLEDDDGKVLYEVAITQTRQQVCATKVIKFIPESHHFIPKHSKGDRDFSKRGPKVTTLVTLGISNKKTIEMSILMVAEEVINCNKLPKGEQQKCNRNKTLAYDSMKKTIFIAEDGWEIVKIKNIVNRKGGWFLGGGYSSAHTYTDTDFAPDNFIVGSGEPVRKFTYIGDSKGNDSGINTSVTVNFRQLHIELKQVGDCINAS